MLVALGACLLALAGPCAGSNAVLERFWRGFPTVEPLRAVRVSTVPWGLSATSGSAGKDPPWSLSPELQAVTREGVAAAQSLGANAVRFTVRSPAGGLSRSQTAEMGEQLNKVLPLQVKASLWLPRLEPTPPPC